MKLKDIRNREALNASQSVSVASEKLQDYINILNRREISDEIIVQANKEIEVLNTFAGTEKKILLQIKATESKILELVRKKYGLVPEKYYTFLWMPLGMTAFGLPLGTLIFAITGNAAFIGVGLPFGIALGTFLGMAMDKKAIKENKVLFIKQV